MLLWVAQPFDGCFASVVNYNKLIKETTYISANTGHSLPVTCLLKKNTTQVARYGTNMGQQVYSGG